MTDWDCCASAKGNFEDVELQTVITNVIKSKYLPFTNGDTYGCSAVVKMLHNQNLICKVNAQADAGNGGYYFSVASFVITLPEIEYPKYCAYLVGSEEARAEFIKKRGIKNESL